MKEEKKVKKTECPLCGKTHELEIRTRTVETMIKDEIVFFEESYYYCENEKEENEFVNGKMLNANLLNARNAYRRKKGLLTSDEIVDIRKQYGLSQVDLANLLGWGEATVSRYESKAIQDKSYDTVLRKIKEDSNVAYEYLEKNKARLGDKYPKIKRRILERIDSCGNQLMSRRMLENVYIKYQEPSIINGMKKLDIDKLGNVINYFASKINNLYKVRLMKLLWYADSLHYKGQGVSMMGLVYRHNEWGALPEGHREIMQLSSIHVKEEIAGNENIKYHILPSEVFDKAAFSAAERNILDNIIKKFKYFSAQQIADYMHEETAYQNTYDDELISYEFAKEIREF